jgi:cysteinyl-tRNA synthetase
MTLRFHDTLTRQVRPLVPLEDGRIGMYTCGPTVYRFAHVGNLRTFLLADLIRRVVLYHGIDVLHVQNITDVGHLRDERFDRGEDRMLAAAGLEGRSAAEIADAYEAAFHEDAARINLLPAHEYPRATEHIPEMVELAERLEDLGHAYATSLGNVYYAVGSFPGYGSLSGNSLEELRAGHRGEVEGDKRDAADFALWKTAGEGRLLRWPTRRWGEGFPGWHLECSAMALRHVGPRFDIHTGGEDNVFPHHEDEIAQSAPIVGGPPANLWIHGAHLLMSGRKMAKSAGNFQRITELEDAGIDPLAFRYLCLTARYGRKLDYSDRSLAAAAAGLASLRAGLRELGPAPGDGPWSAPPVLRAGAAPARPVGRADGLAGHGREPGTAGLRLDDHAGAPVAPLSPTGRSLHDRFVAAVRDDLDLPAALRLARSVLAAKIPADERRWLLLDMDFVLGLDLDRVWVDGGPDNRNRLPAGAERLLAARARARAARDWAEADRLRVAIRDLGIEPIDRADGSSDWQPMRDQPDSG